MAVFSQTISTSDGSDNWGYYNTGNSSWLSAANVFIGDVGGTDVTCGARFVVTVPAGATGISATLTFGGATSGGTPPYGTIYADDVDNSGALNSTHNGSVGSTNTTASVAMPDFSSSTVADVSGPVSEVLARGGWASGNNLALYATDVGSATDYEYFSSATLEITYTEPAGGGTGEVTETLDDATLSSTATISGHVGDVNVSLDAVTLSSTATITQPAFSVEHVYNPAAASNPGTSWSETGVDLSSVETGDIVVVALSVEDAGAFAVSSMSVSGVVTLAAEATADQGAGFRNTSTIWSGVATGSGSASESLNIAVNLSPDVVGVDVFVLKGFDSTSVWSDTQIGTSVTTRSLTQSYSGEAVSVFAASSGNSGTFTWSGATETSDKQAGSASFSTAYINTPATQTTVTDTASASMNRATLAGVAWALAADEGVSGSVTSTLDDATLASTATLAISGAVTATLDDATLVSAGELPITATVTATLDAATLVATGEEPLGSIEGAVTTTLDDATLSSTGVLLVSGAVSTTLDDATLVSAATLDIAGQSTTTLDDVTLVSTGTLALSGAVTATLDPATLDASGALAIVGDVTATLEDATLDSDGVSIQVTVGSLSSTLDDVALASTAEITQPVVDVERGDDAGEHVVRSRPHLTQEQIIAIVEQIESINKQESKAKGRKKSKAKRAEKRADVVVEEGLLGTRMKAFVTQSIKQEPVLINAPQINYNQVNWRELAARVVEQIIEQARIEQEREDEEMALLLFMAA